MLLCTHVCRVCHFIEYRYISYSIILTGNDIDGGDNLKKTFHKTLFIWEITSLRRSWLNWVLPLNIHLLNGAMTKFEMENGNCLFGFIFKASCDFCGEFIFHLNWFIFYQWNLIVRIQMDDGFWLAIFIGFQKLKILFDFHIT